MVVQHNLTAMNSNRMLGLTTKTQAKSTEKLSSGYKINRAADDAAGLSISEKMRKQIRGLTQASLNAQDGISAVQTAEGALTEVHDMLQRMNELAVKSANETNSESDRDAIQAEIDQLVTEVDRVSETTKFNETYLLKGDKTAEGSTDYQYKSVERAATNLYKDGALVAKKGAVLTTDMKTDFENGDLATAIKGTSAADNTKADESKYAQGDTTLYIGYTNTDAGPGTSYLQIDAGSLTFDGTGAVINDDAFKTFLAGLNTTLNNAADKATAQADFTADDFTITSLFTDDQGTTAAKTADLTVTEYTTNAVLYNEDGSVAFENGASMTPDTYANITDYFTKVVNDPTKVATADDAKEESYKLFDKDGNGIAENGLSAYFKPDAITGNLTYQGGLYDEEGKEIEAKPSAIANYVDSTQKFAVGALSLSLHVGADATLNNQIGMKIEAMSAKGIGIDELKVDGKDNTNALSAIETIKAALQKVSNQRSDLGAIQNRLEHTINNLDNVVENTTAAESQIRDTDMATEMVKYSNNNILAQAGQAMLAQANQSNQGVLGLLG